MIIFIICTTGGADVNVEQDKDETTDGGGDSLRDNQTAGDFTDATL